MASPERKSRPAPRESRPATLFTPEEHARAGGEHIIDMQQARERLRHRIEEVQADLSIPEYPSDLLQEVDEEDRVELLSGADVELIIDDPSYLKFVHPDALRLLEKMAERGEPGAEEALEGMDTFMKIEPTKEGVSAEALSMSEYMAEMQTLIDDFKAENLTVAQLRDALARFESVRVISDSTQEQEALLESVEDDSVREAIRELNTQEALVDAQREQYADFVDADSEAFTQSIESIQEATMHRFDRLLQRIDTDMADSPRAKAAVKWGLNGLRRAQKALFRLPTRLRGRVVREQAIAVERVNTLQQQVERASRDAFHADFLSGLEGRSLGERIQSWEQVRYDADRAREAIAAMRSAGGLNATSEVR